MMDASGCRRRKGTAEGRTRFLKKSAITTWSGSTRRLATLSHAMLLHDVPRRCVTKATASDRRSKQYTWTSQKRSSAMELIGSKNGTGICSTCIKKSLQKIRTSFLCEFIRPCTTRWGSLGRLQFDEYSSGSFRDRRGELLRPWGKSSRCQRTHAG